MRKSKGFSLSETLLAILILLLATSVVTAGMPAAASALTKAVDAAHAQVLLSTTMTAIRDELSTAKTIEDPNGATTIKYKDCNGIRSIITVEDDGIYLTKANGYVVEATPLTTTGTTANASKRLLVSDKAATSNMYASFTSADGESIIIISGLKVIKGDNVVANLGDSDPTLKIRVINATA